MSAEGAFRPGADRRARAIALSAHACLAIAAGVEQGQMRGGPEIDVARCREVAAGWTFSAREITDAALQIIAEVNSEAEAA